jgi:SAM-dependent methyltransferase
MLTWTLGQLFSSLKGLSILHVNNINGFSASLATAGSVVHSTYLPEEKLGAEVGGFSNQDVEHLTFEDQRFDVVIHSETVEHVFDPALALRELHRVLKPGGVQIYTVPLLWRRRTRQRMKRSADGVISHLLPPSYHGLDMEYPVIWEFGGDFFHHRSEFTKAIFFDDFLANSTVFSIVESRPATV